MQCTWGDNELYSLYNAPPNTLFQHYFYLPKTPFFWIMISQMHPFLNILLRQRFNNFHSSPYDRILFSNSDYNLLEVHLKLPLKYIEVEIDYVNLFITCTYDHLRLWICHNSFHLGQIIFSARSTPTQIITPQGNVSIAEGGGGGDLLLWITNGTLLFLRKINLSLLF